MTPTPPPLPATPDPQAAGLLSVERLNEIRATLTCKKPSHEKFLAEWRRQDVADLLTHVDTQQAIIQGMQDDGAALAETEFHDQRKYRELVRATMQSLLVGQWPLLQGQEHPFLQKYTARIHEAARALGLTL